MVRTFTCATIIFLTIGAGAHAGDQGRGTTGSGLEFGNALGAQRMAVRGGSAQGARLTDSALASFVAGSRTAGLTASGACCRAGSSAPTVGALSSARIENAQGINVIAQASGRNTSVTVTVQQTFIAPGLQRTSR